MRLAEVIPAADGEGDVEVSSLSYAAAEVRSGALFFCVPGFTRDGHEFAPEAVRRGAVALVVERTLPALDVPQVEVASVRAAMAPAAAAFYGDPTAQLRTIGVTGTNGKTTTAFLIRSLLEADARQTGLLGTVKSIVGGREREVVRTTPEAIDLQLAFRQMWQEGDRYAVIEVSSHALALHRADAIHFAAAVFTNLTQDHLDFHGTMEDYFGAKRRLFVELAPGLSVINVDDPYGRRLAAELEAPITYGLGDETATYRASRVRTGIAGSRFVVRGPEGAVELTSPLKGQFNVLNVLAAFATARALGVPADTAAGALRAAGQVPGRFESVEEGQPFAVIVDYAHTPDSLDNVLRTARLLADGHRLHVVFGAGGDRDRSKRPLMGAIAARLADRVIVTSDNPRSEEPEAIIEEIMAGIEDPSEVTHTVDRAQAIHSAIAGATPGDVVLIAGKGHEQGQEFAGGQKIAFDDAAVARDALRGQASLL